MDNQACGGETGEVSEWERGLEKCKRRNDIPRQVCRVRNPDIGSGGIGRLPRKGSIW